MVETVNPEEFLTQQQKKRIEDYEFVKVRLEAGVAHMTLSRPEHNLLNEAMLRELAEGIEYSGSREDIKIILLDSACKVFCGGIEIGEYTSQRVFQMLDNFMAREFQLCRCFHRSLLHRLQDWILLRGHWLLLFSLVPARPQVS